MKNIFKNQFLNKNLNNYKQNLKLILFLIVNKNFNIVENSTDFLKIVNSSFFSNNCDRFCECCNFCGAVKYLNSKKLLKTEKLSLIKKIFNNPYISIFIFLQIMGFTIVCFINR
ncbi:hypothetical protein BpHYR1_042975 [Brachionus plicatilis]|uniref:Uncharacterized protein n=1 Tax=Brachionus plicatilis TaxID=10195 RepID=A0A3M7P589_BRAPC|nr:hypothetical protein BpHYR1_042975 [Brachionus plicatilis]